MKCTILHETRGRMRVRLCCRRMTLEQADVLEYYLRAVDGVQSVKVYDRTRDAVVVYAGRRSELIRALGAFSFAKAEAMELVPEHTSRALNREFEDKLAVTVMRRCISRLFLPVPVTTAISLFRSVKYIKEGCKALLQGRLSVAVLDAAAVTVSMVRGDFATAGSVMFMLRLGEILEEWTHKKSVADLASAMSLRVDSVWQQVNGTEVLTKITDVKPGDRIVIRTGGMIPLDGRVVEGEAMVNQSSLTGESMPVAKHPGSPVYAGTVAEEGECVISVEKVSGSGRYDRVVRMIEESEKLKSTAEDKASRMADRLVPYTFLGTGLVWLFTGNVTKTISVLMVDFSCALKLAMPLTVLSAIREGSCHDMTVKGGKYLEAMSEATTIVFDKTGTLTKAQPTVAKIVSFNDQSEDELLRIAACLEEHFPHSMAKAVVREAVNRNLVHEELHSKVEYIVAHGISSKIGEKHIVIGSYHFVFEDENATIPEGKKTIFEQLPEQYSHLYMAIDGVLVAVICIEDPLRPEAVEVIAKLKKLGISKVVMMTGDSDRVASAIAKKVGVDEYHSEVLPEDKASFVEAEKNAGRKVIMVGDGINDSPALSAADVGIAISDGAQIAREIADVTVGADDLHELVTLKKISNGLMERIHRNYRLIVGINTSLIVLGVAGVFPPTTSALLHNTSTLLISLKSMNNLLDEKEEVTEENVAEAFA